MESHEVPERCNGWTMPGSCKPYGFSDVKLHLQWAWTGQRTPPVLSRLSPLVTWAFQTTSDIRAKGWHQTPLTTWSSEVQFGALDNYLTWMCVSAQVNTCRCLWVSVCRYFQAGYVHPRICVHADKYMYVCMCGSWNEHSLSCED